MNNTHVKQFTEKKNAEIHLHTAGAAEIQSGPGALFKGSF